MKSHEGSASVSERGCVATARVMIDDYKKRAQNSRTLAFAVAFRLCSYVHVLTCFSLLWVVLGRIRSS